MQDIALNQGKITDTRPRETCRRCGRLIQRRVYRETTHGWSLCLFCAKRTLRRARIQIDEDLAKIDQEMERLGIDLSKC